MGISLFAVYIWSATNAWNPCRYQRTPYDTLADRLSTVTCWLASTDPRSARAAGNEEPPLYCQGKTCLKRPFTFWKRKIKSGKSYFLWSKREKDDIYKRMEYNGGKEKENKLFSKNPEWCFATALEKRRNRRSEWVVDYVLCGAEKLELAMSGEEVIT